jgi:hypothetical protein
MKQGASACCFEVYFVANPSRSSRDETPEQTTRSQTGVFAYKYGEQDGELVFTY